MSFYDFTFATIDTVEAWRFIHDFPGGGETALKSSPFEPNSVGYGWF